MLVVGRASPSAFSFLQNLASVTDWKLDLNSHAIVLDSEGMFQWPITEPAPLDEKRGWYQSDIFTPEQLADLLRIHDGIYRIINDVRSAASTVQDLEATSLLQPLRDQLGGLYSELEQVRAAMRDTVRAYHLQSKILPSALIGYTEELPPALTVFDQVRVANGKLQIRLYMERLLFRAAARAAHRASTMRDRAKEQQNPALLIAEEIESAAEAIVLSAMCLEAYINSILQDRLASLASSLDKMGLKEKWLVIPSLLGHLDCFDHTKQPYQDFSLLVTWRNQLAHYKHEFSNMVDSTKTHGAGVLSATYFICNAENAARAVNTIRAMVRQLNTCLDFPVPQWIDDTGWLQPEGALQGKPPKGQSHSRKRIKE